MQDRQRQELGIREGIDGTTSSQSVMIIDWGPVGSGGDDSEGDQYRMSASVRVRLMARVHGTGYRVYIDYI